MLYCNAVSKVANAMTRHRTETMQWHVIALDTTKVRHKCYQSGDALTEKNERDKRNKWKMKKNKKMRCRAPAGDVTMWQTKQNNRRTWPEYYEERKERAEKPKHNKSTFEPVTAVCGTSGIGRFYLPVRRSRSGTLPACFRQPRFSYDRYPPYQFPWMSPLTDLRRSLLSFVSSSCETRATENEPKK